MDGHEEQRALCCASQRLEDVDLKRHRGNLLARWYAHSPEPVYACPLCFHPTSHPEDIRQGYCGRCHDWTGVRLMTLEDFDRLNELSLFGAPTAR